MEDFWNMEASAWEESSQNNTRICDAPDCEEKGVHKAPKSRDQERDYYWFCLAHVQEYNRRWDYFDGMGRTEIEDFMRDAETGHRPTWKNTERTAPPRTEDLADAVYRMFGNGKTQDVPPPRADIDPKLHKALAVLDMDYPVTLAELKQQYKKLVKKHHPDVAQKKCASSEEAFKRITEAYHEASELMQEMDES
mgnify:CR=1 FL=1